MSRTTSIADGIYVSPTRPNRGRIHWLIQYYPYLVGILVSTILISSIWSSSRVVAVLAVSGYWIYLLVKARYRSSGDGRDEYQSQQLQLVRAFLLIIGITILLYILKAETNFPGSANQGGTLWLLYLLPLFIVAQRGTTILLLLTVPITAGALALAEVGSPLYSNVEAQVLWLALISMIFYVFLRYLGDAIADFNLILNIQRRLRSIETKQLTELKEFDEQQFLQYTAETVAQELAYEYVNIFKLEPSGEYLECIASVSRGEHGLQGESLTLAIGKESSIIGRVISTCRSYISNDVKKDHYYYFHDAFPDTSAELAAPIFVRERLYGVLDVQVKRRNYFLDQDLKAVEILANHVGWVIDSANHVGYVTWTDNILAQLGTSFFSKTDLEDILQEIANLAHQELKTDLVVIYIYPPEDSTPVGPVYAGNALQPEELGRSHVSSDSIVHRVKKAAGKILTCEDLEKINVETHPLFKPSTFHRETNPPPFVVREQIHANAIVRLLSDDDCIGALFLNYRRPQAFSQWDRRRFSFFAHLATLAIQRTQADSQNSRVQFAELAQSVHDMLIGDSLGLFKLVSSVSKSLESLDEEQYRDFIDKTETMALRLYNDTRYISGLLKDEAQEKLTSETERLRIVFAQLYAGNLSTEWYGKVEYIPPAIASTMCAILREACWNAIRHGKAKNIAVTIHASPNLTSMQVIDDGKGFDPFLVKTSGGLRNIRRRVEKYAGHLTVESAPGTGTRLCVEIPL